MKCLEIGDEVGADYIMYRPLVNYNNVQISRPLSELELLKEKIESRSNELGIAQQFKKFIKEFERTVDQKVPTSKKECPIVHDGLAAFVAATGDVVPCYAIYQHKMSQAWSYGNINETDFKEIWNNKLREEVISKIDARKCPFCRFQGHNKIIQNMSEGILPNYGREDKHWKFL